MKLILSGFCPACGQKLDFPTSTSQISRNDTYVTLKVEIEQVKHACPDPTKDEGEE